MSADPNGSGFSRYENQANKAFDHAHQIFNSHVTYLCWPTCKWDRKTKAKLSILALLIITIVVVVPVCLEVPSHHETQTSTTTTGTQTTPATAPNEIQSTPQSQTSLASGASTTVPSSVATSPASSATLPPPPSPTADGIHLMNALDGTAESSGFAYYASAVHGNNGAQPDDYANTTVNVYAEWENQNRTVLFTRTNTFVWSFINSTNAPVNKAVGEASNGYRSFVCYKDNCRSLFKQNGSDFYTEYYYQ